MKRFHYIAFLLVLAAGIAGSALLVPRGAEVGLMYLKDKQYAVARTIYEKRLANGEMDMNVIIPLAELYLQFGEVNKAVALLEAFARRGHDTEELERRVGQYHQFAQRPAAYLTKLEEINKLRASPDSLRELANLYRYTNQHDKLIAVLRALVTDHRTAAPDYLELANLEAATDQPARAAHTIAQLEIRFPEAVNANTVELAANLLLDSKQPQLARDRAAAWLSRKPDVSSAARLASLFHTRGFPNHGLEILKPFEPRLKDNGPLLATWIELERALGSADRAFERLAARFQAGTLPSEVTEQFIDLALFRKKLDLAFAAAAKNGFVSQPRWLIGNLAEAAWAANRPDYVKQIVASSGESFFPEHPLLAAQVTLARGDKEASAKWLRFAAEKTTSPNERLNLADSFLNLGLKPDAIRLLAGVNPAKLSDQDLGFVSQIHMRLGSFAWGADQLAAAGHRGYPWALLAAGDRREPEVLAWLTGASLKANELQDLFYVSNDNQAKELAIAAAERLYRLSQSDADRLRFAESLLAGSRANEALVHFRALRGKIPAAEAGYTASLLAATGPELKSELVNYWTSQLGKGNDVEAVHGFVSLGHYSAVVHPLSKLVETQRDLIPLFLEATDRTGQKDLAIAFLRRELSKPGDLGSFREQYTHALIDRAGKEAAVPYIKVLAQGPGTEWASLYESLLTGKAKLDYLKAQSQRPDLSLDAKREIAYKLIEAGDRTTAAGIFWTLARTAAPDSKDVEELLYLWNRQPPPAGIEWLEARARQSSGPERIGWLTIQLQLLPEADRHASRPIYEALLKLDPKHKQALTWIGLDLIARKELRRGLATLNQIPNPDLFIRSAKASTQYQLGEKQQALALYRTLLAENPKNAELRADYASALLTEGNLEETRRVVKAGLPSDNVRLRLINAELLASQSQFAKAFRELQDINLRTPNRPEALAALALLDQRIGKVRQAANRLAEGLKVSPANEDLRNVARELSREQAAQMTFRTESLKISGYQDQITGTLSGRRMLNPSIDLGFQLERTAFNSGQRERGEMSIRKLFDKGPQSKASLFQSGRKLGAGFEMKLPDFAGQTVLTAELKKPHWDLLETLASGGTRDTVQAAREGNLLPSLSYRAAAGLNRYQLPNGIPAENTRLLMGAVTVRPRRYPWLLAEYVFDSEYRQSSKDPSAALPLRSREAHSANAGWSKSFGKGWQAYAAAGAAVDRLGGKGPFISADIAYASKAPISGRLFFDRRLYTLSTTHQATRIGGQLTWRF